MTLPVNDFKIAVVSDVTLGYGSPQVPSFAKSLAGHFGAPTTIFEPDQLRSPFALDSDRCQLVRVSTDVSPYTRAGRIEYVLKVAEELNRVRPSIVVCFCTFTLPVLTKLKYRPELSIYYVIENVRT